MYKIEVELEAKELIKHTLKHIRSGKGNKVDLKMLANACIRELFKRDEDVFIDVYKYSSKFYNQYYAKYKSANALKRKREAEQRRVDEHNMKMKVERWEDDD